MTDDATLFDRVVARTRPLVPDGAVGIALQTLDRLPIRNGTNVYDREWDVLVVLDGCRLDTYRNVIGHCDAISSVGSTSTTWMDRTFSASRDDEIARTAYVSANPYSHRLDPGRFGILDHVWRDLWNDDLGTIPPDPVTDHGISLARSGEFDRVICHYMQPHFPFVSSGEPAFGRLGRGVFELGDEDGRNVWRLVESGEVPVEAAIEAYEDNLRYVFEHVERLTANVDGTVAITADHGNAFGEWGMWGHRAHVPSSALRRVPWDVRQCEDSGEGSPETTPADPALEGVERSGDEDTVDEHVDDRLQALGYTTE